MGLYGAYCHCRNRTVRTLTLNSILPMSCDTEIAVAIAPGEQAFTVCHSHVDTVHDVKTPDADAAVH